MERLALTCQRLRYVVVAAWLAVVVGLSALSAAIGGDVSDDYDLPGSESHRAAELMAEAGFDFRTGTQGQLVFRIPGSADTERFRSRVDALAEDVAQEIPEAHVVSPFTPEGAHQLSADGSIGYVSVELPSMPAEELAEVQEQLSDIRSDHEELAFEVGGVVVDEGSESGPPAELIGIVAAVLVLLLAFGSVFAMALPILVGIVGAGSGVAVVGIAARWVDMPSFAAPVAAMIAIGVGIDYALLVVTRFREALTSGAGVVDAVVTAQRTAGRSVLFAGITVVIASLGLVLMDLELITGVALGIAGAVLLTMLAAVTLLPALLSIVGGRIDRLSVHRRHGASREGLAARRWSRQIQRHPAPWALAAVTVLVVMTVPVLDMRLGFSDAGTRPESDTARRAYDLMSEGFGAGSTGPLVAAVDLDADGDPAVAQRIAEALSETPGVARVSPPLLSDTADVALVEVVPTTSPRAAQTTELVHHLREEVVPAAVAGSGAEVAIGGSTAATVDFADYTAARLPLFLGVVLGLAMLLLMAVFRGVAVAVKAVVANLLSIGAAFGATVAVFQWGWGIDLLDLGASAPIEAWAPMMLIAIVFGLSMDYEVFLLSRVKEEYDRSRDNATAVAEGLARTARVITAAAAIMVCVFGSFVLGQSRELQLFGFGLAFAVLVDATLVRMVLVPSLMELLGERNWWMPRWLDRLLPRVHVEGRTTAGASRS
ncbi:MMPL family transporter [Nocardioides sp. SYSU DS0651]|uniref:MMPL family transporter n=1 Tax=Nocardioides sp. SYSU DS0651 TaxID=3415955 RepID=UPI003F4C181F